MKPAAFDYQRPRSIEEALDLLANSDGDAKILAGGQSLVPMMNMRLAAPARLVDINHVPGLSGIRADGDDVVLGALTRHRDAELSPMLATNHPVLAVAAGHISHATIRNRGTVAGSIAHCDPAAEWPTVGLATQLTVIARSKSGERRVPIAELLVGPFTTTLTDDELVTEVRVPKLAPATGAAFIEFSRVQGNFALAAVCAVVSLTDGQISAARIALGGVAATAITAPDAAELLVGNEPNSELFARAAEAVMGSINPGSDVQASGEYRRQLAGTLTQRALAQAIDRAQQQYPRSAE